MADREKVIDGLECHVNLFKCHDCPYVDAIHPGWECHLEELIADALAVLKEQEARIVTETDFENADTCGYLPAWCEQQYEEHVYCECITKGALSEKRMRYWTARPTDEQRKAVKWDAAD